MIPFGEDAVIWQGILDYVENSPTLSSAGFEVTMLSVVIYLFFKFGLSKVEDIIHKITPEHVVLIDRRKYKPVDRYKALLKEQFLEYIDHIATVVLTKSDADRVTITEFHYDRSVARHIERSSSLAIKEFPYTRMSCVYEKKEPHISSVIEVFKNIPLVTYKDSILSLMKSSLIVVPDTESIKDISEPLYTQLKHNGTVALAVVPTRSLSTKLNGFVMFEYAADKAKSSLLTDEYLYTDLAFKLHGAWSAQKYVLSNKKLLSYDGKIPVYVQPTDRRAKYAVNK